MGHPARPRRDPRLRQRRGDQHRDRRPRGRGTRRRILAKSHRAGRPGQAEFPRDAHRHTNTDRAAYLQHLAGLGYVLSDVEQLIVDNATANNREILQPNGSGTAGGGDARQHCATGRRVGEALTANASPHCRRATPPWTAELGCVFRRRRSALAGGERPPARGPANNGAAFGRADRRPRKAWGQPIFPATRHSRRVRARSGAPGPMNPAQPPG